mgnify:CR=1 FL=1
MKYKYKILLLLVIILLILGLTIAFSAYVYKLKINSIGKYEIKEVSVSFEKNSISVIDEKACTIDTTSVEFSDNKMEGINIKLLYPSAYCIFQIKVNNVGENAATIDYKNAKIDYLECSDNCDYMKKNILFSLHRYDNNNNIVNINGEKLEGGEAENILVKIFYNQEALKLEEEINGKINIYIPYVGYME